MKITLKVTEQEREYEVTTNLFVIIAWERKFKLRASDLTNGVAMEHLAFMAYECCKQKNIPVAISFEEYLKKLENIEVVEEDSINPPDEVHT